MITINIMVNITVNIIVNIISVSAYSDLRLY